MGDIMKNLFLSIALFGALFSFSETANAGPWDGAKRRFCEAYVQGGKYASFDECWNDSAYWDFINPHEHTMYILQTTQIKDFLELVGCARIGKIARLGATLQVISQAICTLMASQDDYGATNQLAEIIDLTQPSEDLVRQLYDLLGQLDRELREFIEFKIQREMKRELMKELREAHKDGLTDRANALITGWVERIGAYIRTTERFRRQNTAPQVYPYAYSIGYTTSVSFGEFHTSEINYECYFDNRNINLACFER